MNPQFNLLQIHNELFKTQFNSCSKSYAEFHILTALKVSTANNSLKRVFSIMHLTDL